MPVLAWAWGHTQYLVEHEKTGYIITPGNIEESKKGIEYIFDNYERMSRAAREVALTYDWDSVAAQYADVYAMAAQQVEEDKLPLVSIIIPCYNYAHYVLDAINSVKAQTYQNIECIIVDDGSTDDSLQVIKSAIEGDSRFKVLSQRNARVATARNHGAVESMGRFLMFLDADDYLYPDAVMLFMQAIVKDRTLGLVYGNLSIVDKDGKMMAQVTDWPKDFVLTEQLSKRNQVPSCNLMRREAFFRAGGFRCNFKTGEDAELWTRIPLVGFNIRRVSSNPVYYYRLHDGALSDGVRTGAEKDGNWTQYISVCNGGPQPFASIVPPLNGISHPVPVYDEPLLSIVVPCGPNHGGLLATAIESVAAQTDNHWELIVVDDTDEGDLATRGYYPYKDKYPWITWLRNPKLHNVSAARNYGATHAKGRYLAFLDADDYLLPQFCEKTLNVIRGCENDGSLVYTDWISVPGEETHQAENWSLNRLMDHALFAVTAVLPKSAWKDCGGFSEDILLWEDWDFFIKLAMEGLKGIRVPIPLFAYRYNTGKRREESLLHQDELLTRIRSKYSLIQPKARKT
jgi:glycosyltransferase involved in cell wall biosynthesis